LDTAVQEGWIDNNPAGATKRIRTGDIEKKRTRLTLDQYRAIYEQAPAWLRNAMDIGLTTLLRRGDICRLKFSDYRDDGCLYVVPAKTADSTQVRLRIAVAEVLVTRCRDNVASTYLVHRLPQKAKPRHLRASHREHHTQVLPEQLTRAFDAARDACKLFEGVEHPPSFHEIRSLGGQLYLERGWTIEQIQTLMGHASKDMTELYLAGHDAPWTDVSALILT
ncbi:MAG: tyrosine-type recombinase/integrase, partial [Nevskiales bacterium]